MKFTNSLDFVGSISSWTNEVAWRFRGQLCSSCDTSGNSTRLRNHISGAPHPIDRAFTLFVGDFSSTYKVKEGLIVVDVSVEGTTFIC
jgi:hypothetical protein